MINANKDSTNFIYQVINVDHSQMSEFNKLGKFGAKFNYLEEIGAKLSFIGTARKETHNNLTLLDLGLERILADELLLYYSTNLSSLEEITRQETNDDPLILTQNTTQPMYEYKIKQFLLAFALGMTCSKPWHGTFNANGGYIVIKEDGDIICYHFSTAMIWKTTFSTTPNSTLRAQVATFSERFTNRVVAFSSN